MMTPVVDTIAAARSAIAEARGSGLVIGFVPTMGALHDGHVRLVEASRAECGYTVVSVFVNPTQFGPNEDFLRYPRALEADREACARAGADLVFAPTPAVMYPRGGAASTFVEVPGLTDILEGASRPGHFRGVATVVTKLFAIVGPDLAFFGAKDYQQQLVIRRMVDDLNLPVTIRTVPTVREPDGLAMSSRNRYLDPEQRRAAGVLHRALEKARAAIAAGETDANRVRRMMTETIELEVLARLDYAEVADGESLERVDRIEPGGTAVGLLAAWVGATRLIDNACLTG